MEGEVHPHIPLVIDGHDIPPQDNRGIGEDPSRPGQAFYQYALATEIQALQAIEAAKNAELPGLK